MSLFTIIQRILGFPFFAGIALVGALFMWGKWMVNFMIHGGEAIAYTQKMNRKTIQDVFQKITEE